MHTLIMSVEAEELGRLAGVEDFVSVDAKDAIFTDPERCWIVVTYWLWFLAIAIGTSHGAYKHSGFRLWAPSKIRLTSLTIPLFFMVHLRLCPKYVKCNEFVKSIRGKGVWRNTWKSCYNGCM